MVRSQLSVPYSKVNVSVFRTSTGDIVYENIDEVYSGYEVRDKVIIRVDLTKQLTEGILSDDAPESLRRDYLKVVFGLVLDDDEKSEKLKKVYINDDKFKVFLANICYFELPKVKKNSLYEYLVVNNRYRKNQVIDKFWNESVITASKNPILSLWHMYIGVNDRIDSICEISEDYKVEAVSYAKKWNCIYPRAAI